MLNFSLQAHKRSKSWSVKTNMPKVWVQMLPILFDCHFYCLSVLLESATGNYFPLLVLQDFGRNCPNFWNNDTFLREQCPYLSDPMLYILLIDVFWWESLHWGAISRLFSLPKNNPNPKLYSTQPELSLSPQPFFYQFFSRFKSRAAVFSAVCCIYSICKLIIELFAAAIALAVSVAIAQETRLWLESKSVFSSLERASYITRYGVHDIDR